jgi:very-short-patch-repair endonuclease
MKRRTEIARHLRQRQTDAERRLWFRLRDRRLSGLKFKRQVPVGTSVVDFLCADARLIVEIDGGQHQRQSHADVRRTATLEKMGYLVVRYWNNDVLSNIDGVLQDIIATLPQGLIPPHPAPLPPGEREESM